MHRPARRAVARRTRRGPEPGGSAPAEGGKGIEPPPKGPARRAAFDRAFAAPAMDGQRPSSRPAGAIPGRRGYGADRPAARGPHCRRFRERPTASRTSCTSRACRPAFPARRSANRKQGRQWSCRSFRFAGNHHCSKCCNWPDLDKTNIANPGPAVNPPAVGTNRSRFLKPVGVETQCLAVLGNGADQVRGSAIGDMGLNL